MLMCLPLLAQQAQSPPPLMVPLSLCEERLTLLEQKSLEQLTKVENDFAERLRLAVEAGAADTARPLLVDIAGLKAARDSALGSLKVARQRLTWVPVVMGVVGAVLGLVVGLVIN